MNTPLETNPRICEWGTCTEARWSVNDGRCILHSRDENKDRIEFDRMVNSKLAHGQLSFAGTFFPHDIDLSGRPWRGADFYGAIFRGKVSFARGHFAGPSSFILAEFQSTAVFSGATFDGVADFTNTKFNGFANFTGARFISTAAFSGAELRSGVNLDQAKFEGNATFVDTKFAGSANFQRCQFSQSVDFTMTRFAGSRQYTYFSPLKKGFTGAATFFEAIFRGKAYFVNGVFQGPVDLDRAQFSDAMTLAAAAGTPVLSLQSVVFEHPDAIQFANIDAGRMSLLQTDLRRVRFHNVSWPSKRGRIRLYDEESCGAEGIEPVRILYRDLKAGLEGDRDWVTAGDFYYAEMDVTRQHHTSVGTRWLLGLYRTLAGYGERPWRALALLFLIAFVLAAALRAPFCTFSFHTTHGTVYNWHLSWTEALGESVRALFIRPFFFQPENKWANALTLTGNIAGPIQLTLLAITLRRWLRR